MEPILNIPRHLKWPVLGLSDILGHIILVDAQTKEMKPNARGHSWSLWQLDAEMLSVVPAEGAA